MKFGSFLPPPWNLVAGIVGPLLILIGACAWSYSRGYANGGHAVEAKYAEVVSKAIAAMERGAAAIDTINGAYAAAQNHQNSQARTLRDAATQLLPRPLYGAVCVDADGVGLLDRARANGNHALDPGEFTPAAR